MRQATFPSLETDVYSLHEQIEGLMNGRGSNHYIWSAEPIGNRMVAVTIRADQLPAALDERGDEVVMTFNAGDVRKFGLVAQCALRRGDNNSRVPIDVDDDERRLQWLSRRADMNGFEVLTVEIASVERIRVAKLGARHVADRTRFGGTLRVIDPPKLAGAIRNGIGHGKAFGLGLLTISEDKPEDKAS